MTDDSERTWYTVVELAEILRVAPATVRKGIRLGQIPRLQIGTRTRIPRRWVEMQQHAWRDDEGHEQQ